LGVKTRVILNAVLSTAVSLNIMSPDSQAVFLSSNMTGTPSGVGMQIVVRTNTSSQIRVVASAAAASGFYLGTVGWFDNRGK
jgi:hypothetical protein